jgi:tetratricopeptide (TPR) repeat protein
MPENAKVLQFRVRLSSPSYSREQALAQATAYLEMPKSDRTLASLEKDLADGDVLTALLSHLWETINTSPATVAEEAQGVYKWISTRAEKTFFFDERDYFLGESALLAAGGLRLLGKREETELWLDRADAGFRHTVAPAAHLARVSYIKLTLRYDMRRHDEVLELAPSIALTFQKLGMGNDLAKCEFLTAMSLKELGRLDESALLLERLAQAQTGQIDSALAGMALVNLGNLRSEQGHFEKATLAYAEAAPLLQQAKRFAALADLKMMLGGTLQRTGQLASAVQALRESVKDHLDLGMETRAAYIRLVVAGALLEAQRPREAEWEILAAMPTFDEQGMAPEAIAALALLRESVRQRKTDPEALLQLRNYLQAKN